MNRGVLLTASGLGIGGVGGISAFSINYFVLRDKTIKGALERKGIKLISFHLESHLHRSQWAAEYKTNEEAIKKLINHTSTGIENDIYEAGQKLKIWCEATLKKEFGTNPEDLKNAEKYCSVKSIKQQIERLGANMLGENDPNWQNAYNKRRNAGSSTTLDQWKDWCFKQQDKDFVASSISVTYASFLKNCTDKWNTAGDGNKVIEIKNMLGQ